MKDRPRGMAEKLVLPGTPGTPTGSLPKNGVHSYDSNSPTVASLLVGTSGLLSVPGQVDVGTRQLKLGT